MTRFGSSFLSAAWLFRYGSSQSLISSTVRASFIQNHSRTRIPSLIPVPLVSCQTHSRHLHSGGRISLSRRYAAAFAGSVIGSNSGLPLWSVGTGILSKSNGSHHCSRLSSVGGAFGLLV